MSSLAANRTATLSSKHSIGRLNTVSIRRAENENASRNGLLTLPFAAQNDLLEEAEAMIDGGADVNETDSMGNTALIYSVCLEARNLAMVKMLLAKGASPRVCSADNRSALFWACRSRFLDAAAALLEAGAPIDETDPEGWTPLHAAAASKDVELIKLLIKHKASVDRQDFEGFTPLHFCITVGFVDGVRLLASAGAKVNSTPITALHVAVQHAQPNVAWWLLQYENAKASQKSHGWPPLAFATYHGQTDIACMLVEALADDQLSDTTDTGDCAIHFAACVPGCLPVIDALLARKVSINLRNRNGFTPLFWAVRYGNLPAAGRLLDRGASITAHSTEGQTALHLAASSGLVSMVDLLLRWGAENLPDQDGVSPLHYACLAGHISIVELLLEKGANLDLKTAQGYTPRDVAAHCGFGDIYNMVKDHGGPGSVPLSNVMIVPEQSPNLIELRQQQQQQQQQPQQQQQQQPGTASNGQEPKPPSPPIKIRKYSLGIEDLINSLEEDLGIVPTDEARVIEQQASDIYTRSQVSRSTRTRHMVATNAAHKPPSNLARSTADSLPVVNDAPAATIGASQTNGSTKSSKSSATVFPIITPRGAAAANNNSTNAKASRNGRPPPPNHSVNGRPSPRAQNHSTRSRRGRNTSIKAKPKQQPQSGGPMVTVVKLR